MKSKRMMLVSIVTVLALALMGFGFARWSDMVTIGGNVETGNVEVSVDAVETNDPGETPDPNYPPGDNWEGKDVASCEIANSSTGESNKEVTVTINNAYPWYQPGFTFEIKGEGTVPVKVDNVTGPDWTGDLGQYIKVADWEIVVSNPASNGLPEETRTLTSGTDGDATWEGLTGALRYIQLHQGGTITVTVNMYVTEDIGEEVAPQNANTEGTIAIEVVQWNEVNIPQ